MIISSSFSYLFHHWRCFNVLLFRQCSISVLRCSALFPLFRGCSVVPVVFSYSGFVPSFSGCSVFCVPVVFRCSVFPRVFRRSVFRCSWFYSMPLKRTCILIWFWLVLYPFWNCFLKTGVVRWVFFLLNRQNLLNMTKVICQQSLNRYQHFRS